MASAFGLLILLVTYPIFAALHTVKWILLWPVRLARRRYQPRISGRSSFIDAILAPIRTLGRGPFAPLRLELLMSEAEALVRAEAAAEGQPEPEIVWGADDGWRDRFELCLAAARSLRMTNIGYFAMRQNEFLQPLCNRLRVNAWLAAHPEVDQVAVRRPLFITGFPRTGTTFLHEMLSADPAARAPMLWELAQPAPPPGDDWREDPRVQRAIKDMEDGQKIAPQMDGIHDIDALLPNECFYGVARDVPITPMALQPVAFAEGADWWRDMDMAPVYRNYLTTLRILSTEASRAPRSHWVLKWPSHLSHLRALLAAFPDASVVWTHRDPLKCLPSQASLYHALNGMCQAEVDPEALGRNICHHWADAARRADEVVADHPGRVLDINYADTIKRPVETVRRIYDHFGYEFTDEYAAALDDYLEENRRKRAELKGKLHSYTAEQFGMDQKAVDEAFRPYMDAHGVPEEVERPGAAGVV